jgi:hypothetical protein
LQSDSLNQLQQQFKKTTFKRQSSKVLEDLNEAE